MCGGGRWERGAGGGGVSRQVMGGMAALISERLPADKANVCGEA